VNGLVLASCWVCIARQQDNGLVWLLGLITAVALVGALGMAWLERRKS
jgi:hypothetical protein